MDHFELVSQYAPTGDQPQAIEALVKGFKEGNRFRQDLYHGQYHSAAAEAHFGHST